MIIFFPSQVRQARSQEVTITAIAQKETSVSLVSGACTLRLNDSVVDQTQIEAITGDEISLVYTTKSGYANKDTFEFLVNGERSFFVYCTEDDPTKVFDQYYHGKSFLDTVTNTNGSGVSYVNDNTLDFYTPTGPVSVDLSAPAPEGTIFSDNQTYMLDNRSGEIYKIDVDNRLMVKKLELGSPAVGMSVAKKPGSNEKVTWLTLKNGNVVCIDNDENVIKQLAINGVATGIDTSIDGRMVVICDTTANQVFIYENMGGDNWHSSVLPSTGYPYDVFVDAQKNIWITSKLGTKLMVFPFGSRLPIEIEVGRGQKTVKQINERTVGVVCTESDEIVMLDTRTKTVKERVAVALPVDFTVVDKTVYIANAESEVLSMELAGSAISGPIVPYLPANPTIYSLDSDKNTKSLIIAKMYGNTPNMLTVPNRIVNAVAFEGPPQVFNTKPYVSDTVTARGISAPVSVYLPESLEATVTVLNDGLVSGNGTAYADATIKFEFQPTGVDKEKIVFPVLIGNFLTYFESTLKIAVADLKPFRFHNTMLTELTSPYESNAARISGLLENQQSEFMLTKSHSKIKVLINGVLATAPYMVKNEDLVSLQANFETDDFDEFSNSIFLRAVCEDYTTNWQILLVDLLAGEVVTKPYTKGLPLESLNWNLGSWGEITVYDQWLNEIKSIGLWPEDITNQPVVDISMHEVLICDYRKKQVFVVDSLTDTAAYASSILDAGPFSAVRIANLIYVSVPDTKKIVVLNSDLTWVKTVVLTYMPYGLAEVSGKLVVAAENGKLYFYSPVSMYFSQDPVLINGSLVDMVKHGSDLWITDIANGKVKVVRDGMMYKSYTVGDNPTCISFDETNGRAFVVSNYDNAVTEIDTENETILAKTALGRPVHEVTYFNGKWQFIDMQTTSIVEGLHTDNVEDDTQTYVKRTLKQNSGFVQPKFGNKLYVLHLASEYLNILEERVYATSDDFIPQMTVSVREPVTSNAVTINYVSRPHVLFVPPDMGYSLIHNGMAVGESVMVDEGDTVAIVASTPRHFASLQEILLTGKGYAKPFVFQTVPNYIPDYIKFQTIFGAIPGEWAESSEEEVTGLSLSFPVEISCPDPYVVVIVNGVMVKDLGSVGLFSVKNGDIIQLKWEVELNDNALATQHTLVAAIPNVVFASWNIYQVPLGDVADLGVFVNWTLLRYQRGEAFIAGILHQHIPGMSAKARSDKILEVLGLGAYVNKPLTLFTQAFAPNVVINTILTASPYIGALLSTNKAFYGQLTLEGYVKNRVYYGQLAGPSLVKPDSFYGQNEGPKLVQPTAHYGKIEGKLTDPSFYWYAESAGYETLNSHIIFEDIHTYSYSPEWQAFKSLHYSHSPEWQNQQINVFSNLDASELSFFVAYNCETINHLDYQITTTFHTPEYFGYGFEYYTTVFNNLNSLTEHIALDVGTLTGTNAEAVNSKMGAWSSFDMLMTTYRLSDGPQKVQEFSVSIAPEPLTMFREYPVFSTTFYSQGFDATINTNPDTYYGKLSVTAGSSDTHYGRLTPASYLGFSTVQIGRLPHVVSDLLIPVYIAKDIIGFSKQPFTFTKVVGKSTFVMQVELVEVTDQTNITETARGSFNQAGVTDFIDTDTDYADITLNSYQLVDGSWMYYHLNRLPYGECVQYDYIIDHGLVRGG